MNQSKVAQSVNAVMKGVIETHTPTIPSAVREDTSQSRIMGSLEASKVSKTRARLEPIFTRAFASNEVEKDLAALYFNAVWKLSESNLLAVEAADDNLAKVITDAAESLEDISKIQTTNDYALNTQPIEDRITKSETVSTAIKGRLAGNINPVFMPIADASVWLECLRSIAEFKVPTEHKGKNRNDAIILTLKKTFPELKGNVNDALGNIVSVAKEISNNTTLDEALEKVAATFESTQLNSNIDKENAALTGMFGQAHLWVEIVRALAGVDRAAMLLLDPRRSQEASVLTAATLDVTPNFSISGRALELDSPEGFDKTTLNTIVGEKSPFQRNDKDVDFILDHETMKTDEGRAKAGLMIHILNWAGASLTFDGVTDPTEYGESVFLTLPITESVIGELLFDRVTRAWYSFSQVQDKQFQFLESLIGYARVKRTSRMHARIVRAELTKLMKEDIQKFNTSMREMLKLGASDGLMKAVDKSLTKLSTYTRDQISYFDDRMIVCGTSAKDFASTGSVAFTADKAVASVDVPKASRVGFAESLIVRDPHAFNVVTQSGSMTTVSDMYNKIVALATPTAYEYAVSSSPSQIVNELLRDHKTNVLRVNDQKAQTIMASDITSEAQFTPLDDYFVQVVDNDKSDLIRLPSGFGEVTHKFDVIASIEGVLTFGMFTGSRPELGSPFAAEMAKTIAKVAADSYNRYAAQPISFSNMDTIKADLTEKNDKYLKRLNDINNQFIDYTLDVDSLKALLAAPSAPSSLVDQFSKDTFISLKRLDFAVRSNVLVIMKKIASDLYTRLAAAHKKGVVDFVKVMLTRSLTLEEQASFNDPIFASTVRSVLDSVSEAVAATDSEMLKLVFLNELISLITPTQIADSETGE